MKTILVVVQIAFGLTICCVVLWAWLYYIPLPEVRYPDGSQPIGWHSALVALCIVLATQYPSRLVFRAIHPLIVRQ